jgi:hypothetical protein
VIANTDYQFYPALMVTTGLSAVNPADASHSEIGGGKRIYRHLSAATVFSTVDSDNGLINGYAHEADTKVCKILVSKGNERAPKQFSKPSARYISDAGNKLDSR